MGPPLAAFQRDGYGNPIGLERAERLRKEWQKLERRYGKGQEEEDRREKQKRQDEERLREKVESEHKLEEEFRQLWEAAHQETPNKNSKEQQKQVVVEVLSSDEEVV